MKAVILAGGFAKRMWPLTLERPKPLLLVAGKPMIEHVMDKLTGIREIHTIYITTNKRFEHAFREWLEGTDYKQDIRLVIEDHASEDEKLGSIGAISHIIDREMIDDDILCVGADNLLEDNLHAFLEYFRNESTTVFGLHEMKGGDLSKYGIASIDGSGRVTDFEEKPEKPKSNLVSTAIYAFPKSDVKLIHEYLANKNNPDSPGYFISWLYRKNPVHGFVFRNKWFDIGSFETYREADQFMSKALVPQNKLK